MATSDIDERAIEMDGVYQNLQKEDDRHKDHPRMGKNCLKDNLHETRNWCGKTGFFVGIKRPLGHNR